MLSWKHFPGGTEELFRAPILLSGIRRTILIGGGWTFSGGRRIADAIRATGKILSTIYVCEGDPDFYFNLRSIASEFPEARVLAAPGTVEAIRVSVQNQIDLWKPYLRYNGPRTLKDVVIPEPYAESAFELENDVIEIVEARGLPGRRYLYVPALHAVVGGSMLFAGVHIWTAGAPTVHQRAAWIAELDALAVRCPKVVVPGRMASDAPCDASAIAFTRDYLLAFEEECEKANGSEALITAMSRRYPGARMRVALAIGAKVAKGEMNWPTRSSVG
jgi:glyoxylase-like metal-dependent hydrolase (beta-lactamase superfamily II)